MKQQPVAIAGSPALPMIRSLVGVGLACGLLIVLVYEATKPIIQANQIAARQAAIFDVLPGAAATATFRMAEDGTLTPVGDDAVGNDLVFAGYDDQGALIGAGLQAQGMGYQDIVKLLYGYSFDQDAIIGIKILESRETPGLGTRIETDPTFLANFDALDVAVSGDGLAHAIEPVKAGKKEHAWQIDCITGATISSVAVAEMLDVSAQHWVPKLAERPADLAQPEVASGH